MIAVERAIREWVNGRPIVGPGQPLSGGAYNKLQRSPASGAYAVVQRNPEGLPVGPVAEDGSVVIARMQFMVFAIDVDAAEDAAAALRGEIESLTGRPEPCGTTGVTVLVTDNHNGPFAVPGTAEEFCFQVGADFMLTG